MARAISTAAGNWRALNLLLRHHDCTPVMGIICVKKSRLASAPCVLQRSHVGFRHHAVAAAHARHVAHMSPLGIWWRASTWPGIAVLVGAGAGEDDAPTPGASPASSLSQGLVRS